MIKSMSSVLLLAFFVMSPIAAPSQSRASDNYDKLVDDYFDQYFTFHPTGGTVAGFHQYDTNLEDYSPKSREAEIAWLNAERRKFAALHGDQLNQDQRADLQLIQGRIAAQLLELQEIRGWQRNPNTYSNGVTYSIFILMSRNFAPPEERLKSVIAREQKMPANFAAAKSNLKDVPKIYTEIAIQQMPGIIKFFQNDVPAAFKSVTDQKLLGGFQSVERQGHFRTRALSGFPEE